MAAMPELLDAGEMEVPDRGAQPAGFSLPEWFANHIVLIKPVDIPSLVVSTYTAPKDAIKNMALAAGALGANFSLSVELAKVGGNIISSETMGDARATFAVDGTSLLCLKQLGRDGLWYCLFKRVKPGRKYEVKGPAAELAELINHELHSLVNEQHPGAAAGSGPAGSGAAGAAAATGS